MMQMKTHTRSSQSHLRSLNISCGSVTLVVLKQGTGSHPSSSPRFLWTEFFSFSNSCPLPGMGLSRVECIDSIRDKCMGRGAVVDIEACCVLEHEGLLLMDACYEANCDPGEFPKTLKLVLILHYHNLCNWGQNCICLSSMITMCVPQFRKIYYSPASSKQL